MIEVIDSGDAVVHVYRQDEKVIIETVDSMNYQTTIPLSKEYALKFAAALLEEANKL